MASNTRADLEKQWREGVQGGIDRVEKKVEALSIAISTLQITELAAMKSELAVLRTEFRLKSGLWGFAAGALPSTIAILYAMLKK